MSANRPTALRIVLALAAATALLALALAREATGAAAPQILFPVIGPVSYSDDFGDARAQGGHEGNDILAQRRAPVIAVEAGRVVFWTRSANAGCMLYLYGRSGTSYRYIHLNNDLTSRNDNRGGCVPGIAFAPGLRDGQDVRAGQLIGYVGDSGDADGIHPHLHFELHPGDGAAVSPYRWLKRAERLRAVAATLELTPAPRAPTPQALRQAK
jgi:murein DD-endopeptidase MepM/ murein hydrolase activator NlpD